jgi:hypothetical protein
MIKIKKVFMATVFLLLLLAICILPSIIAPHTNIGTNYKNVTVWTHVNITHSRPEVLNVSVYEMLNISTNNITITAGSTKRIYCNATIRDWDGFSDVVYVNATIWHMFTSNNTAPDNNNSHYTNLTCNLNASLSAYIGWYVCSFDPLYYANNGTWMCNVSAQNSWNYTGSGNSSTVFYPVYALNVTDGIDYGGVAVYDYSIPDVSANITNLGNMAINISVEGYGAKRGDGLAMNCSINGNITVDNERFSLNNTSSWASKTPLVSTAGGVLVSGLTMLKQTVPSTQIINSTYWQIYIPPNPAGNCTGNIIFTALAP